ncbi:MAG: phosphoribosyl-ATP diphosphatase, partial [Steroidobacteraceae bacterium]
TRTCFGDASLIRGGDFSFLSTLERVIEERITTHNPESYTARLIAAGPKRLAQKVGEEGLETALALTAEGDQEAKNEAADLLFHLAVALKARGLSLSDVVEELKRRHRPS